MPSFAPRSETVKKQELLEKRVTELRHAIQSNFGQIKLFKAVEKYRAAKLALLKAKGHVLKEKEFQNKPTDMKYGSIETQIKIWIDKSEQEVINEFAKEYGA
jgi:hypothetical protein